MYTPLPSSLGRYDDDDEDDSDDDYDDDEGAMCEKIIIFLFDNIILNIHMCICICPFFQPKYMRI